MEGLTQKALMEIAVSSDILVFTAHCEGCDAEMYHVDLDLLTSALEQYGWRAQSDVEGVLLFCDECGEGE